MNLGAKPLKKYILYLHAFFLCGQSSAGLEERKISPMTMTVFLIKVFEGFRTTLSNFLNWIFLKIAFFHPYFNSPCTYSPQQLPGAELLAQNLVHLADFSPNLRLFFFFFFFVFCWWGFFSRLFFPPELLCLFKIPAAFEEPKPRFLHHHKSTEAAGLGQFSFGKHHLINIHLFPRISPLSPQTGGNREENLGGLLKKNYYCCCYQDKDTYVSAFVEEKNN